MDQTRIFGYGGLRPNSAPNTPIVDTIARNGVHFRNTWAMPERSPSRVMFFEGRFGAFCTAAISTPTRSSGV